MTETVESLSGLLENSMTVQIFTERKESEVCGTSTFSPVRHKTCIWVSPHWVQPQVRAAGGVNPFKNRTRYYGGISKWPVKNKGVPRSSPLELTPWPVFLWQLLFNVVGARSVPDLRRNTSRPYSQRKDWKDAWKKWGSFREPDKNICAVCGPSSE